MGGSKFAMWTGGHRLGCLGILKHQAITAAGYIDGPSKYPSNNRLIWIVNYIFKVTAARVLFLKMRLLSAVTIVGCSTARTESTMSGGKQAIH